MDFIALTMEQKLNIVDKIAFPEPFEKNSPGPVFFRRITNLVVTGYFTSEAGIEYLGYKGNTPNVWDGVPDHLLKKHALSYDDDFLKIAMNPETGNQVMEWDDYKV